MTEQNLAQVLAQLHDELRNAESLDAEQIARLRSAVDEIQETIKRKEGGESLADRLREAVQDFEDSHPSLTNAVGQVADMLAQMGI